jgi:choline monooxygenase
VLPDLTPEALAPAPLARAETIPSSWYTAPESHAFDLAHVMAPAWQLVGHESRLARAGDFLTAAVAGNPVLVVRDHDGALRGYYNVCRHRGGPLAMEDQGHARVLQCKYHGWTYLLDGSLRGVPRFDRTELFDRKDYGLVPVEVDTWEGLVFARLEPGAPALDEQMAGIAERIAPLSLRGMRFYRRVTYEVACNWKTYVDNYLEGYHIPLVHPELADLLDYRAYVTETFAHHSLQHSPLRDSDDRYGEGEAFYYFVFPNVMLNILPGRLQTNAVLPLAADRCLVVFDYHYDEIDEARAEADVAYSDQVQQEDIEICEAVQRGLASRAYDRGRFSVDAEAGVHHFQELLKQRYRAARGA